MNIWRRWQAWTPAMIGVLLITTPFVFGLAMVGVASLGAWILGTVVGLVAVILALLWLGAPSNRATEAATVFVGLVLVIAPLALGESLLTAEAWPSYLMGVLFVATAGGIFVKNQNRQASFPVYRTIQPIKITSKHDPTIAA
jgi:hypothetical protein